MAINTGVEKRLMQKIARVLDETRVSYATHNRKFKELSALRASSPLGFFPAFLKSLTPVFNFQRRTASTERVVRFVAIFAATRDTNNAGDCDAFLEEFLKFLLVASKAANRTARFRACQIISEIIMRLPDETEVSNELWDVVIDSMKLRLGDKVPVIRSFAVRALSRFLNDSENSDILELFLEVLLSEQNVDVRKTVVLSLPPSNATSGAIINSTLDVSELVRKAAYCVLASKFPIQSLSIKLRTIILQRGLADRSAAVRKECLKLMKDEWLVNCCNGDPIELLKFLDVETYELVGESVMEALLKEGLVKVQDGQSIRQYLSHTAEATDGLQLMEAEVALYWRTVCKYLQSEAQAKGSEAATTMGSEAAVYAAEASDSNDLLESVLPAAVSEYVELVKAHIAAGSNYRFASRQLLLLGMMLDFSDATSRKVAGELVNELLQMPLNSELDENGNEVVIGDGINLGGDRDWTDAVSGLARKVHAASGEFEEVFLVVVEELARPCRERTAGFIQWLHCLAVAGLLLEKTQSFRCMQGKSIEPAEILHSILLPGAKHVHLDVQRAAIRCLGVFGLLERKPSAELVKQLRQSFAEGPSLVSIMACRALLDLVMWHGPQEVDKAINPSFQCRDHAESVQSANFCHTNEDSDIKLLDLLYVGLEGHKEGDSAEDDERESVQSVLAEGFAKMLLLSQNFPTIPASSQPLILARLIKLYFSSETKELQRLQQCLSVFFDHYTCLSVNHKMYLSKAFIPVMRSLWPGINGEAGRSTQMISNMRRRAVQASRFLLQMMQAPLYAKETGQPNENGDGSQDNLTDPLHNLENGEDGLAIRIAIEVARFRAKKTAAEKSYLTALCRILPLLRFCLSDQGSIKLMRRLLNCILQSLSSEKELVKELKQMAGRLKAADAHPDEKLSEDQTNQIFGRLEISLNLDEVEPIEIAPTPAPRSTRSTRAKRRVKHEESSSDEESSPNSVVPINPATLSTRSQRASKAAAMSKLTTNKSVGIDDDSDGEEEEEGSELTSEDDDSDEFDHSA